jgi:pimeloyl-ACP methyl ester carboxylesterase
MKIAYQLIGQGSLDLVLVPGFISNLDVLWELPEYDRLVRRLSSFSRLILFDKRGTGLSDRFDSTQPPDFDDRTDDIRTVLDATGSGHAALIGSSDGAARRSGSRRCIPIERVRSYCSVVMPDSLVP